MACFKKGQRPMKRKGDKIINRDGKVLLTDKNGKTRFIIRHSPDVYARRDEFFERAEYKLEYEENYLKVREEKIAAMREGL